MWSVSGFGYSAAAAAFIRLVIKHVIRAVILLET